MVAPITGPFNRVQETTFSIDSVVSYRQSRPYNLVTQYRHERSTGSNRTIHSSVTQGNWDNTTGFKSFSASYDTDLQTDRHYAAAYNQAYERFANKIGDTAGWAENAAQYKKAAEMINNRATQFYKFVNNLRKGRFGEAAGILRTPRPSNVSNRKAFAQNFLEWEYGWSPLLRDISSSVKILTDTDFGVRHIKASASAASKFLFRSYTDYANGGNLLILRNKSMSMKVRVSAIVRITNPNLYLAHSMGVIDPALPWKLVPFSFVADWFGNVEQVLSSLTPFLGVSIERPCVSRRVSGSYTQQSFGNTPENVYVGNVTPPYSYKGVVRDVGIINCRSDDYRRDPGIPSPTFVIRPFEGFSVNRGAQACSLIVAVFGR